MNKYYSFSKRSVSLVWFISYIMVSLITVLFNFIAYMKIDNNVSTQNEHYVNEILENRKTDIDNLTRVVSNVALEISQKKAVRKLAFMNGELSGANFLNVYDVIKDLEVYKKLENEFDNIYIYFYNTDYCVSLNSANYSDIYYDVNIKPYGITKAEWFKCMFDKQNGKYAVFSSGGNQNVTYFYSVYSTERFVPYATIAIELDGKKLLKSSSNPSYNDNFYIYSDDGVFIADDISKKESCKKIIDEYGVETGIRSFKENMTMIAADSESNDWKYFYLVDRSVFVEAIHSARINVAVLNLVGILIMLLVAIYLVKFNYYPVKKIISIFGENQKGDVSEFKYIQNKISSVMNENLEISRRVKSFDTDLVREAILSRIMSENLTDDEREKMLSTLINVGVLFPFKSFVVLLIHIDINMDMFFDNSNDAEENYRLARVAVINITAEVLSKECKTNFCNLGSSLCCVANLKSEDAIDDVVKKLKWIKQFISENFNIEFSVGVSNVHSDIDELRICLSEATECIKERLYSSREIIVYNEIESSKHMEYCLPTLMEEQLVDLLRNNNSKSALNILDGLFDEKNLNKITSVHAMKCVLYNLVIVINRGFGELGGDFRERISEIVKHIDSFEDKSDIDILRKKIYEAIEYGCAQNGRKITDRIGILMERAKAYVDSNYMDINLSVTAVAHDIEVSLQYLSTNFKKKYKVGLFEYITLVRIEHAKELLSDTNTAISDIAEKVGYVNTRSFFRSFMRIVGTSPKEYRNMKR